MKPIIIEKNPNEQNQESHKDQPHRLKVVRNGIYRLTGGWTVISSRLLFLGATFTLWWIYSHLPAEHPWYNHQRGKPFCYDYSEVILTRQKWSRKQVLPWAKPSDINPLCLGPPIQPPKWYFHTECHIFDKNVAALSKNIDKAIEFGCMHGWNYNREIHLFMGPPPAKNPFNRNMLAVWYQTEQNGSTVLQSPGFRAFFQEADFVWDFSRFDVKLLENQFGLAPANKGGRMFYVPFWTALSDEFFLKGKDKTRYEYDVLLFGLITPRRSDICEELKNHGVRTICGIYWGEDLLEKQRKSRILLNVHVYPVASLEVHRINPVLANGMVVVSEKTSDVDIDSVYNEVLTMASYDNLVDTVLKKLAQTPEELEEERRRNIAWIKERVHQVDAELCFALTRLTIEMTL